MIKTNWLIWEFLIPTLEHFTTLPDSSTLYPASYLTLEFPTVLFLKSLWQHLNNKITKYERTKFHRKDWLTYVGLISSAEALAGFCTQPLPSEENWKKSSPTWHEITCAILDNEKVLKFWLVHKINLAGKKNFIPTHNWKDQNCPHYHKS